MQINIGTPCTEDWNKMIPNETGKHCSSCNKSVIDIRDKSDTELNYIIETNATSGMCIRANKNQISDHQYVRPLKRLAFALLIVFGNALFSISASAQEATQKLKETYLKHDSTKATTILIGTVLEYNDEPMPFANVGIYLNNIAIAEATTDFDGKYTIVLDETYLGKEFTLRVSYVGYYPQEVKNMIIKKGIIEYDFVLDGQRDIMGDMIIIEHNPPLIEKEPENLNKTTFKREEIQRSSSGR